MRSSVFRYVLVVSVLLNVTFVGSAAYTHYKEVRSRTVSFTGPAGLPSGPSQLDCGAHSTHLFQELSLRPEQVSLFQLKAAQFHETLNRKRQEVDRQRVSLIGLMRAENPDGKAIEAAIAQISATQKEMQKTVVSHMLEFKSMLNKDQQKKFLGMIEEAMTQRKEGVCP